jgi:hypothetical protein
MFGKNNKCALKLIKGFIFGNKFFFSKDIIVKDEWNIKQKY